MQINEFESLTGIRPTLSLYAVIERAYMDSGKDKAEFCRDYELNVDGIASKIQALADREEISQKLKLESRIAELQKRLDERSSWHEMNVPKKRVLELALATLEREIRKECIDIARVTVVVDATREFYNLGILLAEWKEIKNELICGENQESGKEVKQNAQEIPVI